MWGARTQVWETSSWIASRAFQYSRRFCEKKKSKFKESELSLCEVVVKLGGVGVVLDVDSEVLKVEESPSASLSNSESESQRTVIRHFCRSSAYWRASYFC